MVDPLFRDSAISPNIIRFPKFEARTPKRDERRPSFRGTISKKSIFNYGRCSRFRSVTRQRGGPGREGEGCFESAVVSRDPTSAAPSSFRRLQISNRSPLTPPPPPEIPRNTRENKLFPLRSLARSRDTWVN